MILGVVSDTHNNLKNIDTIISIFNEEEVDLVIHTGDITNSNSLAKFSNLKSEFFAVYGNNDINETGLEEVALRNKFTLQKPPLLIHKSERKIAVFHEPEPIKEFLLKENDYDIVVHGHTHRYREEYLDKTLLYNPGESAGMLKGKNAIGLIDLKYLITRRIFF